ncbi:MAG: thermonuclease family protein [Clostridia bacterium]|nr:thermonuclease family protein [Clostridia bacterium]
MKKLAKFLLLLVALSVCLSALAACVKCPDGHTYDENYVCTVCGTQKCDVDGHDYVNGVCKYCGEDYPFVDYVDQCRLDMNSNTAKYTSASVVRQYVDGDTTHFNVPVSDKHPEGVLKARYLAVNTPESTGQVEPYGKVASDYTHETLDAAIKNGGAVLVESDTDDNVWNNDSYGRTLAWVWYKPTADAEWRNLNLELLQKGYGLGSSASDNRYGEYCMAALEQAINAKLIVHSKLKDDNYFYGSAIEIDLKELRTNFSQYELKKVAFEGYVTNTYSGSTYVQWYCEEDSMYYGISVYYNGSNAKILEALSIGNHVRVVGTATNFNGSWQVSGLSYNVVNSKDPANTIKLDDSTGQPIEPTLLTIPQFNSNVTVDAYDADKEDHVPTTYKLHQLLVDTSVKMISLYVYKTYTTDSGTSKGAFTLYCRDNSGNEINVRTEKLYKKNEATGLYDLVTADEFEGKIITVVGMVDWYNYNNNNEYQIRVINYSDIAIIGELD